MDVNLSIQKKNNLYNKIDFAAAKYKKFTLKDLY